MAEGGRVRWSWWRGAGEVVAVEGGRVRWSWWRGGG